jgi:VIT1/CCC1 family predicted Fe2+/Mn2+ transporter
MSASKVEPFVIKAVGEYIDSKKYLKIANSEPASIQTGEIDNINREIGVIKNTMQKYFKLFEASQAVNTKPFIEKINELQSKLDFLENKKQALYISVNANSDIVISDIENFSGLYANLENSQRKQLLRRLIKNVIVTKDKLAKSVVMLNNDIINL